MTPYIWIACLTGKEGGVAMVAFCAFAEDLPAALQGWRAELPRRDLDLLMLQWAGPLEALDPDEVPIPIDLEALTSSAQDAPIAASDFFQVEAPSIGAEQGVYFGFFGGAGGSLRECALAAESCAAALAGLLRSEPGLNIIAGLSDASLAGEEARFAGKPLALAALALSQGSAGQLHLGERLEEG